MHCILHRVSKNFSVNCLIVNIFKVCSSCSMYAILFIEWQPSKKTVVLMIKEVFTHGHKNLH